MRYDVVIAGGGLAGLGVARQLKQEQPGLRILVAEKRVHPVPEAAFKVGESTVELGAHYLQTVLGLDAHLREHHLEKLGIRYFFPQGDNRDIARRVEVGPPEFPAVPSFQIDRGRLENHLLRINRDAGIEVVDGATVRAITLCPDEHKLTVEHHGDVREVSGRWLVDASGRSGLLRRKLGLTRSVSHLASASWFRISQRIKVDEWSADPSWRARISNGGRWLSTNHLMGRGYWVWLIPLGSGSTSVGIVVDSTLHPYERINRMERAIDWLREFEPQCAGVVEAHQADIQDFLALKHYAYGCERVYSRDRWLLVGEAGLFTDPFYSPGSDFIGMGSEFISEIIARDQRGEDCAGCIEAFNTMYLRLFDAFLRLYEQQYRLMGNAQVMTIKAAWDNGCYWAITALLFFQRRYRDDAFLRSIEPLMRRFVVLHARMQTLLRAWDIADRSSYAEAWANVIDVDFLRTWQRELGSPRLDDAALREKLEANLDLLTRFAAAIQALAGRTSAELTRYVPEVPGHQVDINRLVVAPVPSVVA